MAINTLLPSICSGNSCSLLQIGFSANSDNTRPRASKNAECLIIHVKKENSAVKCRDIVNAVKSRMKTVGKTGIRKVLTGCKCTPTDRSSITTL